jgi:large subunit ribosomal protein L7/L12
MVRIDSTALVDRARSLGMINSLDRDEVIKAAQAMDLFPPAPGGGYIGPPGDWTDEEDTTFKLMLTGYAPANKISVIKAIRQITGWGLKESKDASESLPKEITTSSNEEQIRIAQRTLSLSGGETSVNTAQVRVKYVAASGGPRG